MAWVGRDWGKVHLRSVLLSLLPFAPLTEHSSEALRNHPPGVRLDHVVDRRVRVDDGERAGVYKVLHEHARAWDPFD